MLSMKSTYELRKNAPNHFWSRANNARFAAFYLFESCDKDLTELQSEIGYNGTVSIGLYESYLREASLALELALKSSIATLDKNIPQTHDLLSLWKLAEAEELNEWDKKRLKNFRTILVWAGRYATPAKEEYYLKDKWERVPVSNQNKSIQITKSLSLDWTDFDTVSYTHLTLPTNREE